MRLDAGGARKGAPNRPAGRLGAEPWAEQKLRHHTPGAPSPAGPMAAIP